MSEQTITEAPEGSQHACVVVSRVISQPLDAVWAVLMTREGAEALLGRGAMLGDKGHSWTAQDGRTGYIRSFHPKEQIRFRWRKNDDTPASSVDLRVREQGPGTTLLSVEHSDLRPDLDPGYLRGRWEAALERIESDCF
ncbi:Activator of Hsp90 ATPase homolog 1-like protein [Propionibacterium cyclohexanicum]|uniref:Activator of Hsp90 ATPase homolog 1-like protein n=1 Tax=Propionibacterium cyclohexanicum TaxID=64702 RepID=A0A1H9RGX2_9ACTN|nr:SRPBCC domain-containing protein [Propionibacterium cyclohexanicum]SER71877.1 Activator of Hsp90 ATPase homolog 1-like protein [Propionibacterium cyclohexanicum]